MRFFDAAEAFWALFLALCGVPGAAQAVAELLSAPDGIEPHKHRYGAPSATHQQGQEAGRSSSPERISTNSPLLHVYLLFPKAFEEPFR